MKYKIVYFGSSPFSLAALEALSADERYEIVGVVSQPDKPVGRKQVVTPTPVSSWALDRKIPLLVPTSWKKNTAALEQLKVLKADVGMLVIYGMILPQSVIDTFPKGIVNIHPSMLPKYRGPAPAPFVILNGDTESAVAIMLLDAEMDAGPIIALEKFSVSPSETPQSYYSKSFRIGTNLLMKSLPVYLNGTITPTIQDNTQATYTHMLSRDDGKIDWSKSAEQIERQVRAFTPWPGTWTEVWEDEKGKLYLDELMRNKIGLNFDVAPWPSVTKKRLKILEASIDAVTLNLITLQLEGESSMSFSKFLSRIS